MLICALGGPQYPRFMASWQHATLASTIGIPSRCASLSARMCFHPNWRTVYKLCRPIYSWLEGHTPLADATMLLGSDRRLLVGPDTKHHMVTSWERMCSVCQELCTISAPCSCPLSSVLCRMSCMCVDVFFSGDVGDIPCHDGCLKPMTSSKLLRSKRYVDDPCVIGETMWCGVLGV